MNKRLRKKKEKEKLERELLYVATLKDLDLVWEVLRGYEDKVWADILQRVVCDVAARISRKWPADWTQIRSALDGFFFTPDLIVESGGVCVFVKPGEFVWVGQKMFISSGGRKNVEIDSYAVGTFVPKLRRIEISATAIFGCQFTKCPCGEPPCIKEMTLSRARDLIAHEIGHAFDSELRDDSNSSMAVDIASEKKANAKSKQWGFQPWLGSIERSENKRNIAKYKVRRLGRPH